MEIYLHKILPVLLLPVGMTLLLVVAGLLLRRRGFIWLGLTVLWLSSTPLLSDFLVRAAEGWAERRQAVDVPHADAIVVLSGGRVIAPGIAAVSEWGDANRFYGGLELFKAGRADRLIFTGGWAPWQPKAKPEGALLIEYAKALGVPAQSMLTTGVVVNTAEEAAAVAEILSQRPGVGTTQGARPQVLLVTSAFHMPRAQRLFERVGLAVTPFPVDFQVSAGSQLSVLDFLPSAEALRHTELAWRELYGRLYYAAREAIQVNVMDNAATLF